MNEKMSAVEKLPTGISSFRDGGEPGVFVTFEESPADIRANMEGK